jgi:hypothetical protein
MSTINVSDLRLTGAELFADAEGFMNDLSSDEQLDINGGGFPTASLPTRTIIVTITTQPPTPQAQPFSVMPYPKPPVLPPADAVVSE